MASVLKPWVTELPWKQQSILFSGLRGPDNANLWAIKQVIKWMRSVSQENADPSKPYMKDPEMPAFEALEKELEHSTCHFVHHFADALAVIAYGHPHAEARAIAFAYHYYVAEEIFHFVPERPEIFRWRHRDKPNGEDPEPEKPFDDREWVHDLMRPAWGLPHE